jgi:peptidoglycan/LPS O-acetylase OafA/YrhL
VAVFGLDGIPVAFGHGFLPGIPNFVEPLDRLPETIDFQKWAPFGLFPSRLGEFAIGMVAAFTFLRSPARFNAILLRRNTAWIGVLLWLLGNGLVYSGLWGWIFADFILAVGLVLWLFPLCSWLASRHDTFSLILVSALGFLGLYSYQIFLVHLLVGSFYAWLYSLFSVYTLWSVVLLLVMNVATTLAAAVLLARLDRWLPFSSARLST